MSMTLHTYVCIFGAKPELMIQIKVLPEHGLILEFNSRRWNETAKGEIQTVTEVKVQLHCRDVSNPIVTMYFWDRRH